MNSIPRLCNWAMYAKWANRLVQLARFSAQTGHLANGQPAGKKRARYGANMPQRRIGKAGDEKIATANGLWYHSIIQVVE